MRCKIALLLSAVILLFILASCAPADSLRQLGQKLLSEEPQIESFREDAVVRFLGKEFGQIRDKLGEPAQEGYSSWYGPHYYLLYRENGGSIRFCSPDHLEPREAVSIIAARGVSVLGVEVGMTFVEIEEVLGQPDYGPEARSNDLYYVEYILFDGKIYVSFSAGAPDGPTKDVFIKKQNILSPE